MNKCITKFFLLAAAIFTATANADVVIELRDPGSFLDLQMADVTASEGQEQFIRSMNRELSGLTRDYLDENQRLHITFEEIDLAGRIEPMRGRQNMEVRVVNSMDPIRLKFSYRLSDADNSLVREGSADLRDFVRQTGMHGRNRDKSLYFEKRMMRDWFRNEFSDN